MTLPLRWRPSSPPGLHGSSPGTGSAAYHQLVILIILILGVLAVGVIAAVIVSRSAVPGVEAPVTTQSFAGLPQGPVHSGDIDRVRLDLAFRGYRMDQVDAVLTRLGQELAARDHEIDRLRTQEDQHGDL